MFLFINNSYLCQIIISCLSTGSKCIFDIYPINSYRFYIHNHMHARKHTHTHTHPNIHSHTYIFIYICLLLKQNIFKSCDDKLIQNKPRI